MPGGLYKSIIPALDDVASPPFVLERAPSLRGYTILDLFAEVGASQNMVWASSHLALARGRLRRFDIVAEVRRPAGKRKQYRSAPLTFEEPSGSWIVKFPGPASLWTT
jgi:hypothetical protein